MTVKLPHLEIWQRDVFNFFTEHPKNYWCIVKSIRQVGKSILAQILLIYASLKEENSVSYSVSPVMSQSRKMYDDITRIASPLIKKANGTLLQITFINGSKINFKSAEQSDSIRGETCKKSGILVVDEAAYMKTDFFYSILVPLTNVYGSNIFIFSTPKFKQGFFYDLYLEGLENSVKCKSFDWTTYDTSKYLTNENLELYRRQMPQTAFRAEFLGEFISGDGMVFSNFRKNIRKSTLQDGEITIAIDWGTGSGSDDTCLTIGQVQGNSIVVPEIRYFNDKKTQETIDYIVDLVKSYIKDGYKVVNIVVEKNSIGSVYFDILKDALDDYETYHNDIVNYDSEIEINLQTFQTTNTSKKRIIERITTLFEQDKLFIVSDDKLINQLSMFEATVNSNGTVFYAGANNSHDDTVMSLGFLVDILFNEIDL